jgi:DNA-binding CsgD family transcriptional regulator
MLSDLIGAIYDCALNPANWESALARVSRELSFFSSVLGIYPLRAGPHIVNVGYGLDANWRSVIERYTPDMEELWGGAQRLQNHPLDEPILASQCASPAQRRSNRYNREVLIPRGVIDAVGVAVAREPALLGYMAFDRHHSAGPIGETELRTMRLLAPHFRRAVTISNLFDLKSVEVASFTAVLDGLAPGIVLVDERLAILHANPAAEAMLAAGDPIRSVRGALALTGTASQAALEAAVAQAARDEAALGQRGIGIPAARRSGEPAVVHLMPLRRREMRGGLVQRAVAALFIVPGSIPSLPMNALALLYDLTPAEVRVFELVCAGRTPAEIAAEHGLARSTVKTHLLHVFEKTGCKRQLDLVKLAMSLSLPL